MSELKRVLMLRDGLSSEEADEIIAAASQAIIDGEDPEEVLFGMGLEPDYIFDLL